MRTTPISKLNAVSGRIFDIQRFSIHDGPGIRTTIFMKGCPLRCVWCHNSEGIDAGPLLSFLPDRCIGCGYCFRVCPNEAHQMQDGRHLLDRARCVVCGKCAEECYAGALEIVGREATVEQVMQDVLSDRPFYETSGGGMTLSGGEPLMQIDFAEALLRVAKEEKLHNAIETCGHVTFARFERVMPLTDLFLYDIKETDPGRHVEFTGVSTELIIANLRKLHEAGASVLLRLPVVPGLNDRKEHFRRVADLARKLPGLLGLEVMPYHRLGTSKRERFGIEGEGMEGVEAPDEETVASWVRMLRDMGAHVINEIPSETD